jgi:hypothetical protein
MVTKRALYHSGFYVGFYYLPSVKACSSCNQPVTNDNIDEFGILIDV